MDDVVEACARHTDVLSFNHYDYGISKDIDRYAGSTGKPILIGEYGFDGVDCGLLSAHVPVADQQARAMAFSFYTEQAAAHPAIVGLHYFQYVDEPLTGRGDGETEFNGFVSVTDVVYRGLAEAARKTNERIYAIHAGLTEPTEARPRLLEEKTRDGAPRCPTASGEEYQDSGATPLPLEAGGLKPL